MQPTSVLLELRLPQHYLQHLRGHCLPQRPLRRCLLFLVTRVQLNQWYLLDEVALVEAMGLRAQGVV